MQLNTSLPLHLCIETISERLGGVLRRDFLALAGAAATVGRPRWRGFNLQEKFTDRPGEWTKMDPEWDHHNEPFLEADFDAIASLGFNFVRLPMSYRCWTDFKNPARLREPVMKQIDQAVGWGKQYGLHVCLNFHRAPGFSINEALLAEPYNLWTDSRAQELFVGQWTQFAERYRGSGGVSFNLVNEPNRCTSAQYSAVIQLAVKAIRGADPQRHVMIDGLFGEAMLPVQELAGVPNATHSTRGYAPFALSHYLAPWAGTPRTLPTWPLKDWDAAVLNRWCVYPWKEFEAVFVGEWGCWNRTPHAVTLAWMRDFLTLWKQADWGWALWCFRGSFGILDSGRTDVKYENWRGHKLDRRMLELLQEF
jgi:endoglucanase